MPRSRHLSALLVGVLSVSATSCRNTCGSRSGTLTSNQSQRGEAPCMLTSGSGARLGEGCYDAITGQPVPCPPSTGIPGGMALPAPTYPPPTGVLPRADELPFPSPNETIPRPGVPFAPPMPAPGAEGAGLNPKGVTTPVKGTPKQ